MKKDKENMVLFGVCSGLGKQMSVDASLIRAAFVIATLLGIGFPILIYIVLALVMDGS